MDFLEMITTQFVRDRIKETDWEKRSYIADLCNLERILLDGGPHSVVEAMFLKTLSESYPVEFMCIKRELESGERTSQGEYVILKQNLVQEAAKDRWAEVEARMKKDEHDLDRWVKAGGR